GQTNVGTVSGAASEIAGANGGPVRADIYMGPAMSVGAALGIAGTVGIGPGIGHGGMGHGGVGVGGIGYPVDPTALAVYPRAAAQRGRGLHGQLVQQLGQMIVAGE